MKKYELTNETFVLSNKTTLRRIKALRDFGDVKKGDLGGWIEKEENLSHEGDCWVYNDAQVYDNAKVYDDAKVYGDAYVYNEAMVYDKAEVYNNAEICDNAIICGNAEVFGNACVCGYACVCGEAKVYNGADVYNNAYVYGNAKVYNNAKIYGNARVCDKAEVYGKAWIEHGKLTKDIKEDLIQYIACSLCVYPVKGKYILYKKVNKIEDGKYKALYDSNFVYEDGKIVQVKNYDTDFKSSCSSGIHCSTPFYWKRGDTLIAVEVNVKDIITCMEGKIRAKKVKVLGEVDIK